MDRGAPAFVGAEAILPFLVAGAHIKAPGNARLVENENMMIDDDAGADALRRLGDFMPPEAVRLGDIPATSAADGHRRPAVAAHGNDNVAIDERRSISQIAESAAGPDVVAGQRIDGPESIRQRQEQYVPIALAMHDGRAPG